MNICVREGCMCVVCVLYVCVRFTSLSLLVFSKYSKVVYTFKNMSESFKKRGKEKPIQELAD